MFIPGVLVLKFINSSWTSAYSYLFQRSNRCEHAKGNMQKTGNFHVRKIQWKISNYVKVSSNWNLNTSLWRIPVQTFWANKEVFTLQNHPAGRIQPLNGPVLARGLYVWHPCSTDSASLLVDIEKKIFLFLVWRLLGVTSEVGVFLHFLATFTWPWVPTHWPILLAQAFCGN